jgi:cbb3-type cytochrome oxidase subunit 3
MISFLLFFIFIILFQLGFLAFAADVYGKGKRGTTREENYALMKPYRENRSTLLKNRLLAALNYVKSLDFVDPTKVRKRSFFTHHRGINYCLY